MIDKIFCFYKASNFDTTHAKLAFLGLQHWGNVWRKSRQDHIRRGDSHIYPILFVPTYPPMRRESLLERDPFDAMDQQAAAQVPAHRCAGSGATNEIVRIPQSCAGGP